MCLLARPASYHKISSNSFACTLEHIPVLDTFNLLAGPRTSPPRPLGVANDVLSGKGGLEVRQPHGLLVHTSGRLVADGDERPDTARVDGLDAAHKVQLCPQRA
jgi:hypothetical protein